MAKTVTFYNVGIYLNDELTDISFLELIDSINNHNKDRLKIVRKIDNKIAGVFELIAGGETSKRIIPFGKFRTTFKPYIGEITKTDLDQINKSIIELVTVLYDDSYKVACVDFNSHGLKIRDIEKYLNTFLPSKKSEKWEVKFEPIIVCKDIDKVAQSRQIKNISIKLNLRDSSKNFINESIDINTNIFKALATTAETEFDANVLKLEFGVGNKQKATMQLDAVKYLLDLLNFNTDYVASTEITYRDNTMDKIDNINLKNNNIELKDTILNNIKIENPSPKAISSDMDKKIEKHKVSIIRAYRNYISNARNKNLPEVVIEPNEKHKILIQKYSVLKGDGEKVV
ncbi:DUF6731 family protein [Tepidibacter sp. Z1-5]|uniref:DUF6731 family protein n=1 Tax=Tepidibacter sp. Z1-5 TaxID=3134138 RepID=UPI0030BC9089